MLKRTVVRLLLFGIPFGLSYWTTRPAPARIQTLVVCAYPGDQPGELRINVHPVGCAETGQRIEGAPVSVFPAITDGVPTGTHQAGKPLNIPF